MKLQGIDIVHLKSRAVFLTIEVERSF